MQETVEARAAGSPALEAILSRHAHIRIAAFEAAVNNKIEFGRNGWNRQVLQGDPYVHGPYGLAELMDNNPLVCADMASCPGPSATLAAIAVAPLAKAAMLTDRPAFVFSFDDNYEEVNRVLETEGWIEGAAVTGNPMDLDGCLIATSLSEIRVPQSSSEIDDLYDECFARSFFVRRHEGGDWGPQLVRGTPGAMYQLILSPGEPDTAILRVDVIADPNGKCGAAQLVHMLNIMCGFEEDHAVSF
ncbi:MAG: hypothetical protein H0W86_02845 [Armatimonadetes bacterium]|nr:hypothetical protein [Armatimonadota bacterium]